MDFDFIAIMGGEILCVRLEEVYRFSYFRVAPAHPTLHIGNLQAFRVASETLPCFMRGFRHAHGSWGHSEGSCGILCLVWIELLQRRRGRVVVLFGLRLRLHGKGASRDSKNGRARCGRHSQL